MPQPPIDPKAVFLNVPYDKEFGNLYIAYIVGLYQLGLVPRIAGEIGGGKRRLDRIFDLLRSCRYSIHDLSRVELSVAPPATPRFNMPLELGMAIAWTNLYPKRHDWFLFEAEPRRVQKSVSDLDGTDVYIHSGTPDGVLCELRNAFWRDDAPSIESMQWAFQTVADNLEGFFLRAGTRDLFAKSIFKEICLYSCSLADVIQLGF
jgi:hypothetical protein